MKQCQSCGMPLGDVDSLYGTYMDGSKNKNYCRFCFHKGRFTLNTPGAPRTTTVNVKQNDTKTKKTILKKEKPKKELPKKEKKQKPQGKQIIDSIEKDILTETTPENVTPVAEAAETALTPPATVQPEEPVSENPTITQESESSTPEIHVPENEPTAELPEAEDEESAISHDIDKPEQTADNQPNPEINAQPDISQTEPDLQTEIPGPEDKTEDTVVTEITETKDTEIHELSPDTPAEEAVEEINPEPESDGLETESVNTDNNTLSEQNSPIFDLLSTKNEPVSESTGDENTNVEKPETDAQSPETGHDQPIFSDKKALKAANKAAKKESRAKQSKPEKVKKSKLHKAEDPETEKPKQPNEEPATGICETPAKLTEPLKAGKDKKAETTNETNHNVDQEPSNPGGRHLITLRIVVYGVLILGLFYLMGWINDLYINQFKNNMDVQRRLLAAEDLRNEINLDISIGNLPEENYGLIDKMSNITRFLSENIHCAYLNTDAKPIHATFFDTEDNNLYTALFLNQTVKTEISKIRSGSGVVNFGKHQICVLPIADRENATIGWLALAYEINRENFPAPAESFMFIPFLSVIILGIVAIVFLHRRLSNKRIIPLIIVMLGVLGNLVILYFGFQWGFKSTIEAEGDKTLTYITKSINSVMESGYSDRILDQIVPYYKENITKTDFMKDLQYFRVSAIYESKDVVLSKVGSSHLILFLNPDYLTEKTGEMLLVYSVMFTASLILTLITPKFISILYRKSDKIKVPEILD